MDNDLKTVKKLLKQIKRGPIEFVCSAGPNNGCAGFCSLKQMIKYLKQVLKNPELE